MSIRPVRVRLVSDPCATRSLSRRAVVVSFSFAAAGVLDAARRRADASQPDPRRKDPGMPTPATCFAYVGCRTTKERNARGDGINIFRIEAENGRWTRVQLVPALPNPSYLCFDRTGRFLYTVHGDASEVSAFRRDPQTGTIEQIGRTGTEGKNPVHLAVDATNRWMVVANHITSTVALLPRHEDGTLGAVADLVTLEGPLGPHRVEQPFAKPHQVEFDPAGRFVVVPDKGLDRTFTFRLDTAAGRLVAIDAPAPKSREGAGPRHVAFHPSNRLAYVVDELSSTVTSHRYDPDSGALAPFQVVSTLPDTHVADSRASEIAASPDGRFVYASNRGHDSIAVFSVEPRSGRLAPVGWTESRGRTPRFFAFDPSGAHLHVANEDSDAIVSFAVDRGTGLLSPVGDPVGTGSPVCIIFAPAA